MSKDNAYNFILVFGKYNYTQHSLPNGVFFFILCYMFRYPITIGKTVLNVTVFMLLSDDNLTFSVFFLLLFEINSD